MTTCPNCDSHDADDQWKNGRHICIVDVCPVLVYADATPKVNTTPHTLRASTCPVCQHETSRGWLDNVHACVNASCRVVQYQSGPLKEAS